MRYLTVPRTLCFIFHGDDVLLIQRARHKRGGSDEQVGDGGVGAVDDIPGDLGQPTALDVPGTGEEARVPLGEEQPGERRADPGH